MTLRLDGVALDAYLANAVKGTLVRYGTISYWSTPERHQQDTTIEVLEINLNGKRLLNYLAFQVARFPHTVTGEWYDDEVNAWEPLRIGEVPAAFTNRAQRLALGLSLKPSDQGEPLRFQITDSMPVRVGTATAGTSGARTLLVEHPQHHGADHWVPVTWKAAPVTTKRVRLLLVRSPGVPPELVTGGPGAYSLGIRGLQIGYRVNAKGDIPSVAEITGTTFGSSVDLLGSRVTFTMRANAAAGVMDSAEGTAWRSEPQPVNYAVVNFYVDTRAATADLAASLDPTGDIVALRPDVPQVADQSDASYLENTAGSAEDTAFDPATDAGQITIAAGFETDAAFTVRVSANPDFNNDTGVGPHDPGFDLFLRAKGDTGAGTFLARSTDAEHGADPLPTDGNPVDRTVTLAATDLAAAIASVAGPGPYSLYLRATSTATFDGSGIRLHEWWVDAAVPTTLGLGQVIDRFYLDPLTVGAHCNLYYSNDEPTGEFRALDEPLAYPIAQEHGSLTTGSLDPSSQQADVIVYSNTVAAFTDINNAYLQFNPRKAWWLAMDLLSGIDGAGMAGGVDDHPWFVFGGNTLRQIGQQIEFVTRTGKITSVPLDDDHMINAPFRVSVVFNPVTPTPSPDPNVHQYPKGLTLTYQFADREPVEVTRDVNADDLALIMPRVVAIGRYNDASAPGVSALAMRGLVLKIEKPVDREQVLDFFEYPRGFTTRPDSALLDTGLTDNALLRAHAMFSVSATNPAGLVGGPGDRYGEMSWTPVHRDYLMRKGFLHIPPTRAKYWKFEFTQLVAEHYESFVPIRRNVKLFPAQTVEAYRQLTAGTNWNPKAVGNPGVKTALDLSDVNRYADAVGLLREISVDTKTSHTATEALYVRDPSRAAAIARIGWIWSYQPWHIGSTSAKFVHTQRHEYEVVTVEHRTKIGYFAGIKSLLPYRVDYLIDDDTEQYDEHFHDRLNIADSVDVVFGPNRVSSYSVTGSVTSKTFNSKRPVRGLQFATIQSDAIPLLTDDGFRGEDLTAHWDAYGDASLTRLPDRTVSVNRGWYARTYEALETGDTVLDGTYGGMDGHRYGELEGNQPTGLAGGGISSEPVTPSASGRVYAAVKVATGEALSGPVVLEIVSADGDVVLATGERSVTAGQEETFHIGYRVGSAIERLTYAEIEGVLYGDLDGTTYASHETAAITGDVYARAYQPGQFNDQFLIKRLSLFDAALTWEFSNDDGTTWWDGTEVRNNPEGVLTFPADGTRLRWRLRSYHPNVAVSALSIRPWYR